MNSFWIILSHTYFSKLKTKSFIITTIITALLVAGLANMNNIIGFFEGDEAADQVLVMDQESELYAPLAEQLELAESELIVEQFTGTEEEAEEAVTNGEYSGLLLLSMNSDNMPEGLYKARSVADSTISGELQGALQQLKTVMAASEVNLTQEQLNQLYDPVSFNTAALEDNAKSAEELNQARGLVYVLLFVIYFAVIMYANMIAMEVATEKSSRVMEILISSVPPIRQMFAKILGVALLSLTQMLVILAVGYYFVKQNLDSMQGGFFEFFGFGDVPAITITYAVIFFILGYFLYATLAAFLGSLVSKIEDVQQMITPMTMVIVAAFLIAMFGLTDPEASFVTITSYIPFFTPMIMFMRVGMLTLPVWEPILGIAILLISIIVLAIFGAKVYKGGVLLYGKSSSFKDIKKALQLSNKE
ncbi:ABC transporter permease [Cytobacillus gottheilii]|uniref:ABC transporter permease n=1 Tax=Cytobacillus gottheilii TaxID=859144 RepID=A0ABX8FFL4_9BACI|nr:ABC transporter permease [Cytobacillus gottheilii]QVY62780.1 ABC transporter permease [Cytobacillus gottheilii]